MADEYDKQIVTNSGKAPRGIFTRDGMVTVNPGQTREVFVTKQIADEEAKVDGIAFGKAADPLDHDGDGVRGGSLAGEESTRSRGAKQ